MLETISSPAVRQNVRSILVIDDDEVILRALTTLLGEHGEVVGAGSVAAAEAALQSRSFDAVVTDYELADGDGMQILKYVRTQFPEVPVIMITAFGSKDLVIRSVNGQVFGFIEKPYKPAEVLALVGRALKKREEDRLSSRFAELGQAAGHMAHEINNPLTLLYHRIEGLREAAARAGDGALLRSADSMQKSAERITSIVQWAKGGLRGQRPVRAALPVKDLLTGLYEQCEARAAADRTVLLVTPDCGLVTLGDRQRLHQVLVNLVNNALDAVAPLAERWVMVEAQPCPSGLAISVTDSGQGIPEAVRERLFTPLFTTKGERGSGLGLGIVRKIVEEHGGQIFLNERCANTQFIVILPLAPA